MRDAGAIEVYPGPAALLGHLQTSMIGKLGNGQQGMSGRRMAG